VSQREPTFNGHFWTEHTFTTVAIIRREIFELDTPLWSYRSAYDVKPGKLSIARRLVVKTDKGHPRPVRRVQSVSQGYRG
jgi:hypothetical protein